MSINNFFSSSNESENIWSIVIFLTLFAIGAGMFGWQIAMNQKEKTSNSKTVITEQYDNIFKNSNGANAVTLPEYASLQQNVLTDDSNISRSVNNTSVKPEIVFASKNGTRYYSIGCKAGNRINDENKVFFQNVLAAAATGLEPAVNCDF